MAETRANTALTPEIWDDQFTTEFFQNNPFSAYAGAGNDNPIVMKEDFAAQRGNGISFPFITNLEKGSIRGRQPLRGHEDKLGEYADKVHWDMRKKGISIHEMDRDLAAIDLRGAARGALRTWADEDVKFETIERLQDVGTALDIDYTDATDAQRNTWHDNNSDRILYGAARANFVAGNHAASLANVDSTNDRLTGSAIGKLKRLALTARPRVTPIASRAMNRRVLVAFVHPFVFRDVVNDLRDTEATVNVAERNEGIFLGGDREYDGVIIHEVDDMPIYTGAGNGGIDVSPVFVLGNEALGWAIKQRYRSRTQQDDYGQVEGLGMIGKWGMKKLGYTVGPDVPPAGVMGKQRGVVTGYFAATGD